jgi:hypothetical protein
MPDMPPQRDPQLTFFVNCTDLTQNPDGTVILTSTLTVIDRQWYKHLIMANIPDHGAVTLTHLGYFVGRVLLKVGDEIEDLL